MTNLAGGAAIGNKNVRSDRVAGQERFEHPIARLPIYQWRRGPTTARDPRAQTSNTGSSRRDAVYLGHPRRLARRAGVRRAVGCSEVGGRATT